MDYRGTDSLDTKTSGLLLQACCGPCAVQAVDVLSKSYRVTVYFWGGNIHPVDEYARRLEAVEKVCAAFGCPLVVHSYDESEYLEAVCGLEGEKEGGVRCDKCFEVRLNAAAEYAYANGFDYLASSLTVSPHKNAELVNRIGAREARRTNALSAVRPGKRYGDKTYSLKYLQSDFKADGGFQKSVSLSKQLGVYRQNYCGCKFSRTVK